MAFELATDATPLLAATSDGIHESTVAATTLTSVPIYSLWQAPDSEGLSIIEKTCFEASSEISKCRSALVELDASARELVKGTQAPGRGDASPADFVDSIEERKALDDLMQEKMPAKIMVMGEMNAGKSSLITRLLSLKLGKKGLLPTQNKHSTQNVTVLKYSDLPTVKFVVQKGADRLHVRDCEERWTRELREGRSLHNLLGDPEGSVVAVPPNMLQVEIGLPLAALRGGIEIVDSPGLGANEVLNKRVLSHITGDYASGVTHAQYIAICGRTRTTATRSDVLSHSRTRLLPRCDSTVVYVLSASAGGIKVEDRKALEHIKGEARSRVMFVVTKIDQTRTPLLQDEDEDDELQGDELEDVLSSVFTVAKELNFPLVADYESHDKCPYLCPVSLTSSYPPLQWGKHDRLRKYFEDFEASFISLLKPALWAQLAQGSIGLIARLTRAMTAYESYMLTDRLEVETMLQELKSATPRINEIVQECTKKMDDILSDQKSSLRTVLHDRIEAFKKAQKDAFLQQAAGHPFADEVVANKKPTDDVKKDAWDSLSSHLNEWLISEICKDVAVCQAVEEYKRKLIDKQAELSNRLKTEVHAKSAQRPLDDAINDTLKLINLDYGELNSNPLKLIMEIFGVGLSAATAPALFAAGAIHTALAAVAAGAGFAAAAVAVILVWDYTKQHGPFDWEKFKTQNAASLFAKIDAACILKSFDGVPTKLRETFEKELNLNKERLEKRLQQNIPAFETTKAAFRSRLNHLELLRAWAATSALPASTPDLARPFSGVPALGGWLGNSVELATSMHRAQLRIDMPTDRLARQLLINQMGFASREALRREHDRQVEMLEIASTRRYLPDLADLEAKIARREFLKEESSGRGCLPPFDEAVVIASLKSAADKVAEAARQKTIADHTEELDARHDACVASTRSIFFGVACHPVGADGKETTVDEAISFRWLMKTPEVAFIDHSSMIEDLIRTEVASREIPGSVALAFAARLLEDIHSDVLTKNSLVGEVSLLCFPFGTPPEMQQLMSPNARKGAPIVSPASWDAAVAWCVGILLHKMITGGESPFVPTRKYEGTSIYDALRNDGCRLKRLPFGNTLVESCLTVDPSLRPDLEKLLNVLLKEQANRMKKWDEDADMVEQSESTGFSLRLLNADEGADGDVLSALKALLVTKREWLGKGKDSQRGWIYDHLKLKAAWRVDSDARRETYVAGRKRIMMDKKIFAEQGISFFTTSDVTRDKVFRCDAELNETMLLHGTPPELLLSILSNGPNERYSGTNAGTAFGDGVYLAEDVGKTDQYSTVDHAYDARSELHQRLYDHPGDHPGDVFYVLVCRTTLGHCVRTKHSGKHAKSMDTGQFIFPISFRELSCVPGLSGTRKSYHSLIAELGGALERYREFVIFHGDSQIEVEYLVAYQRCQGNDVARGPAV